MCETGSNANRKWGKQEVQEAWSEAKGKWNKQGVRGCVRTAGPYRMGNDGVGRMGDGKCGNRLTKAK